MMLLPLELDQSPDDDNTDVSGSDRQENARAGTAFPHQPVQRLELLLRMLHAKAVYLEFRRLLVIISSVTK